eukprot:GHVQ01024973.1.p1 GENE.GHVQ01024973.1~~GHVQ01024973.1.p1  ORF type:complete len:101 (+),score=10.92 GHVQ01024973.1:1540-1842(+)
MQAKYPQIQVIGTSSRFGLGMDRVVTVLRKLIYPEDMVPVSRVKALHMQDWLLPNYADIVKARHTEIDSLLPPVLLPSSDQGMLKNPPSVKFNSSHKISH